MEHLAKESASSAGTIRKAPVPPLKNWEAGIAQQKRRAERAPRQNREKQLRAVKPGVAWEGDARFTIPAGSRIESSNGLTRIRVSLASDAVLTITGADDMFAALNLAEPQPVQGSLRIERHPACPHQVKNLLLLIGPCTAPRFELRSSKRQVRNAVWSKKLKGGRISIVKV